jgi:alpha-glucosidase
MDAVSQLFEVNKEDFGGQLPDEPLSGNSDNPDDYAYLNHIYTQDLDETYWMIYEWRKVIDEFSQNFTRYLLHCSMV